MSRLNHDLCLDNRAAGTCDRRPYKVDRLLGKFCQGAKNTLVTWCTVANWMVRPVQIQSYKKKFRVALEFSNLLRGRSDGSEGWSSFFRLHLDPIYHERIERSIGNPFQDSVTR